MIALDRAAEPSAPIDSPVVLEARRLRKVFPSGGLVRRAPLVALSDVSFAVRRGRILAIVGESGSGKSTIARVVARLLPATSGELLLDGADVLRREPRRASLAYRRRVQMIFQDPFGSLNPANTVGYHVTRPLLIHGVAASTAEAAARARDLLATVGLEPAAEVMHRYPHELSGGQRQRVAIARAIAPDPEVVLADEPTSMLDVSIRIGVLNLMERLKRSRGLSFVYITHDLASARYVADEILVMYGGHAVEHGPADAVTGSPAHPYTRLLLASVPDPERRPSVAAAPAIARDAPRAGCPFASRCPSAIAACVEQMPDATLVAPSHRVRCHVPSTPNHEKRSS